MVSYKDLGFVNTKKMFEVAIKEGFAVPAYNFNNMEQLQAIVSACLESQSPVILQVSKGAREYADQTLLQYMGKGAVEMMRRMAKEKGLREIPIALHLDHGDSYELCVSCIESGFSSVMIDGSHLSYEENVELTRKVVEYAHKYDVTVEGELGVLAGVEDEVSADHHVYTDPNQVEDFVNKTGVDSLAIAIGTSHGAYKFKGEPKLDFERLAKIRQVVPIPLVLHGGSGIPDDDFKKAISLGICKI
ncbi:MAG: ketose-bisphosphate aldolase, partial [Pseudothermotoga sp.]